MVSYGRVPWPRYLFQFTLTISMKNAPLKQKLSIHRMRFNAGLESKYTSSKQRVRLEAKMRNNIEYSKTGWLTIATLHPRHLSHMLSLLKRFRLWRRLGRHGQYLCCHMVSGQQSRAADKSSDTSELSQNSNKIKTLNNRRCNLVMKARSHTTPTSRILQK